MTFIPDEELKERTGIALAPMIDFLFLMLAVFASLAVSRIIMRDTEVELVRSKIESSSLLADSRDYKLIHITISQEGNYKWVTEIRDYPMETPEAIAQELIQQYSRGLLPEDKLKTQILLKIDRDARWESILQAILAIREAGFEVRPVYEPS
jgi:biopolymer transport protein ExbD